MRKYPPREAFATRPPPEMAAEGGDVGEITGLDRPRFVEDIELGIPHTRERPCDSVPSVALSSPELEPVPAAPPPAAVRPGLRWWWPLLCVGLLTGVAGAAFGYWLALGGS